MTLFFWKALACEFVGDRQLWVCAQLLWFRRHWAVCFLWVCPSLRSARSEFPPFLCGTHFSVRGTESLWLYFHLSNLCVEESVIGEAVFGILESRISALNCRSHLSVCDKQQNYNLFCNIRSRTKHINSQKTKFTHSVGNQYFWTMNDNQKIKWKWQTKWKQKSENKKVKRDKNIEKSENKWKEKSPKLRLIDFLFFLFANLNVSDK